MTSINERVLVIIGESTADEIRAAAQRNSVEPWDRIEKIWFDIDAPSKSLQPILQEHKLAKFIVGIAEPDLRRAAVTAAEAAGLIAVSVIDPSASIDPLARIAPGCFVAANAVVSSRAQLSGHVMVHFNASIGHDSQVGEYAVVLPGARVSGQVSVGESAMVGSNAFVYQGVKIGSAARVDALTYVREDLPDRRTISVRRPEAHRLD